jgi:hypothetical protein
VHGHGPDGSLAEAYKYWTNRTFVPGRRVVANAFVDQIRKTGDHFAVVAWDGRTASDSPYWHVDGAGTVAEQISDIKAGYGDGITPASEVCNGSDTGYYIVAHSQGAQIMTYISANSVPGSKNYNTVYTSKDVGELNDSNALAADFDDAMVDVRSIFTLGGAVNGTEGMDHVCDGGFDASLIQALGEGCVPPLQTHDIYNPSALTDRELGVTIYALGGYRGLPGSSSILDGEDDGVINLASQMNCEGSPRASMTRNLVDHTVEGGPFRCDNAHKRHDDHKNMASMYEDHDSERNARFSSTWYAGNAEDVMSCSFGFNMAGAIANCISSL